MSNRSLSQPIVVERSCATETAADDHTVAVASQPVTDATENLIAFTATHYNLFGDGKRERIDVVRIVVCLRVSRLCCPRSKACRGGLLAGVVSSIRTQEPTRHRAFNRLAAGKTITKERRSAIRLHLRLVLHVTSATTRGQEQEQHAGAGKPTPAPVHCPCSCLFTLRH